MDTGNRSQFLNNNRQNGWNFNSLIALMISFTAIFLAICNIKDVNIVQVMQQAQANTIDQWGFYQAKSTKGIIMHSTLDVLKQQKNLSDSSLTNYYKNEEKRYSKEKAIIKDSALYFEYRYNELNIWDNQFDVTDGLFALAISILGITALIQNRRLLYFASIFILVGIVIGTVTFFKVNLHFTIVEKLLN